MPTTLQYLLSCNRAINDQYTKKISYIDVFNIVAIQKNDPVVITSFCIGGKAYSTEGGEIGFTARIVDPNGTVMQTSPLDSTKLIPGDVQMNFFFNLVKFSIPGKHYIKVSANGVDLDDNNKFFIEVKKLN